MSNLSTLSLAAQWPAGNSKQRGDKTNSGLSCLPNK